jgi:hypothetical protein
MGRQIHERQCIKSQKTARAQTSSTANASHGKIRVRKAIGWRVETGWLIVGVASAREMGASRMADPEEAGIDRERRYGWDDWPNVRPE